MTKSALAKARYYARVDQRVQQVLSQRGPSRLKEIAMDVGLSKSVTYLALVRLLKGDRVLKLNGLWLPQGRRSGG